MADPRGSGQPWWRMAPRSIIFISLVVSAVFPCLGDVGRSMGDNERHAQELYELWTDAYDLHATSAHPPETIQLPSNASPRMAINGYVPPAPHLEACASKAGKFAESETRGPGGELPAWASPADGRGPRPPWIRGADRDNLAMTRVAQADIWAHQFPASCRANGTKFLLVDWLPVDGFGVGSQLHVMTSFLSLAMEHGRIFVPRPGTFDRARHEQCQGDGYESLSCYFWPIAAPACEERALHLATLSPEDQAGHSLGDVTDRLAGDAPLVHVNLRLTWSITQTVAYGRPVSIEILGVVPDLDQEVHWWRAQALRFFLRWPTPYLCHVTNRVRHLAYGLKVAAKVASALWSQHLIANGHYGKLRPGEGDLLRQVNLGVRSLQDTVWARSSPYMMRPIVSLHIRQGDKGVEMRVFSLAAHMWLLERLRLQVPLVHHVWLSTEMQEVVEQAATFGGWSFWFSQVQRQTGATRMRDYEASVGFHELTAISFANLIIASECDYFVGAIGSNWVRMLNELRNTNGRLRAGYISPNYSEV
eukprot:jgi/Mesen1/6624/ME000034S06076